jgi:NADP-dependent 3-hydroxy acid dehydrogenase YdfG
MNVYSKLFAGKLGFKDEATARHSVALVDELYGRFARAGDRAGQHHALSMALVMFDRARWTGKEREADLFRQWLVAHLTPAHATGEENITATTAVREADTDNDVPWNFSYNGKSVLITGASRGLGLVLARQLLEAGARVAICARQAQELEVAARELREQGGEVLSIPCDVREPAQVRDMVADVLARWGMLDVLINNAGVIEVGPLEAMTLDDFQRAMDTHYWGVLHTVLAVLPAMRRRGWGRFVNIASFGGKQAVPHLLPYTASKFALVGLSHGLRTELARDGILEQFSVVFTECFV